MKTISYSDLLEAAFDDETILSAGLDDLKRYLLACTEMRESDILNPRHKEGLPKRTEFIKQLIALKQSDRSHLHLVRRSNWSFAISLITLILLGVKTFFMDSGYRGQSRVPPAPEERQLSTESEQPMIEQKVKEDQVQPARSANDE